MDNNGIPFYSTVIFTDVWDDVTKFKTDFQRSPFNSAISSNNPDNVSLVFYLLYARYGNNPIANLDVNQWKFKMFSVIFQYGPTWEKRLAIQETLRGLNLEDLVSDGQIAELFRHEGSSGATKGTTGRNVVDSSHRTAADGTTTTNTDDIDTNVTNHAFNPGGAPATDAFAPLTYINEQNANKVVKDDQTVQEQHTVTSTTGQDVTNTTSSDTLSGTDAAVDNRTRTLTRGKLAAYEHLIKLLDSDVTGEFLNRFRYCFKQFVAPEAPLTYIEDSDEEQCMPTWLTILVTVVGLLGTVLGVLGITAYIAERMKHKAERRNNQEDQQEQEIEQLRHEQHLKELKLIVNEAIEPLKSDLAEVKEDIILVKKGTQATCRNDLEEMFALAEKEGFCSNEDKQKFEATYQAYHALGKNGVMDAKRSRILSMPETK